MTGFPAPFHLRVLSLFILRNHEESACRPLGAFLPINQRKVITNIKEADAFECRLDVQAAVRRSKDLFS